jgi:tol-pal system protein YbgF
VKVQAVVGAAVVVLSGCALKGDVRRVELQVQALQADAARADSARAAELARVLALLGAVQDSLSVQQRLITVMRGDVRSDLIEVQRQLVQVQELTGQSQQRLSEMRAQLERREQQPATPVAAAPGDTTRPPPAGLPGPDQLLELGLQQLRRGSPQTARTAFQQFLQAYGTHERVPDALYFLGESWAGENPDSAAAAYMEVARRYPTSSRAPGALYKLGLLAERGGDRTAARAFYQRVLTSYPRSEEAALAREKLKTIP